MVPSKSATRSDPHPPVEFVPDYPIDLVYRNQDQPRKRFDPQALQDLAASICSHGVMQPIVVRPIESGDGVLIVAGERRWRACQMAGLSHVPVIIRHLSDSNARAMTLAENLCRSDLNLMEEAAGYLAMYEADQLTHEQIAAQFSSKDNPLRRERVTRLLRLFNLPEEVQGYLREGKIDLGHAECLLQAEVRNRPGEALRLGRLCVKQGLTVARLKALIEGLKETSKAKQRKDPNVLRLEQTVSEAIGQPFAINKKGRKFEIVIHCSGTDEVTGLIERLGVDLNEG